MSSYRSNQSKMKAALQHFKEELKNLRTGRANPAFSMVYLLKSMASHMRLKELANVTAPEPRQLLITPFDPQTAGAIAKASKRANLNLQPILEGNSIRINVPPMDEAMRKEIVKARKEKSRRC